MTFNTSNVHHMGVLEAAQWTVANLADALPVYESALVGSLGEAYLESIGFEIEPVAEQLQLHVDDLVLCGVLPGVEVTPYYW